MLHEAIRSRPNSYDSSSNFSLPSVSSLLLLLSKISPRLPFVDAQPVAIPEFIRRCSLERLLISPCFSRGRWIRSERPICIWIDATIWLVNLLRVILVKRYSQWYSLMSRKALFENRRASGFSNLFFFYSLWLLRLTNFAVAYTKSSKVGDSLLFSLIKQFFFSSLFFRVCPFYLCPGFSFMEYLIWDMIMHILIIFVDYQIPLISFENFDSIESLFPRI